jgi:hypothetical protein
MKSSPMTCPSLTITAATLLVILVVCCLSTSAVEADCMKEHSDVTRSSTSSQLLSVSGEVARPVKLSVNDLKEMKQHKIKDVPLVCFSGRKLEPEKTYKGVLLKDILEKASIDNSDDKKRNQLYVVASALDGYSVVFSWNEIFNSASGESILVSFARKNTKEADADAQFLLISARDRTTGPRYVRSLNRIEVRSSSGDK